MSLAELDQDILARTTAGFQVGSVDSYVTRGGFPHSTVNVDNVRTVGACLKRGHYKSAAQYYFAATSFQLRRLHVPVQPYIRFVMRDCVRSFKRGLGPPALKDSFDVLVEESSDCEAFDFDRPAAAADALLMGACFMLREVELAAARIDSLEGHYGGRQLDIAAKPAIPKTSKP